jgi:hypothetical protein
MPPRRHHFINLDIAQVRSYDMTYTQVWDAMKNQVHDSVIKRDVDGAFIPFDDDNIDYQEYKKWLGKGNNPNSYEAPPVVKQEKTDTKF